MVNIYLSAPFHGKIRFVSLFIGEKMSTERQNGSVVKNFKEKVQAVTYAPEAGRSNTWLTLKGVRYAVWLPEGVDIYPGSIIEHTPYVEKQPGAEALLCTKVIKVL